MDLFLQGLEGQGGGGGGPMPPQTLDGDKLPPSQQGGGSGGGDPLFDKEDLRSFGLNALGVEDTRDQRKRSQRVGKAAGGLIRELGNTGAVSGVDISRAMANSGGDEQVAAEMLQAQAEENTAMRLQDFADRFREFASQDNQLIGADPDGFIEMGLEGQDIMDQLAVAAGGPEKARLAMIQVLRPIFEKEFGEGDIDDMAADNTRRMLNAMGLDLF